jgi:hypothetical protein
MSTGMNTRVRSNRGANSAPKATPRAPVRNTNFRSQEDPANEAGADEVLFVPHRDELLHEIAHWKSTLEISRGQVAVSSQELHTARNALYMHPVKNCIQRSPNIAQPLYAVIVGGYVTRWKVRGVF